MGTKKKPPKYPGGRHNSHHISERVREERLVVVKLPPRNTPVVFRELEDGSLIKATVNWHKYMEHLDSEEG